MSVSSDSIQTSFMCGISERNKNGSNEVRDRRKSEVVQEKMNYMCRKDQVIIDLRVFIYSIENINTLRQEMVCEFLLSANWFEKLTFYKRHPSGDIDWDQMWNPRLYFPNAVEMRSSLNKRVVFTDAVKKKIMIQWSYRVKGRFKCPFDITSFPFDDQVLSIHVSSYWSDSVVKFRQEMSIGNSISSALSNFADSGQWVLQQYILSDVMDMKDTKETISTEIREPLFQFHVHAQRKYNYYLWNIAAMVNMISFLAFTSFAIDRDDIGKRLSVSLTLLLTVVAFKNFVSSILPKVSYLTLLDKYVLFNVAFIFLVAIENAVVGKVGEDEQDKYDSAFLLVSIVVYVLYQTVFIIASIRAVKGSRAKFKERYIGEFSITQTLRRASEILKYPVLNGPNCYNNTIPEEEVLAPSGYVSHSTQLPRKQYLRKTSSNRRFSFLDTIQSSRCFDPHEVSPQLCFRKENGLLCSDTDSSEEEQLQIKGTMVS